MAKRLREFISHFIHHAPVQHWVPVVHVESAWSDDGTTHWMDF